MDLSELLSTRTTIEDLFPNATTGNALTVSFDPDAITPKKRKMIMGLKGSDDECEAVMTMLEIMGLEWSLTKDGKPIIPRSVAPEDQPDALTLQDVPIRHLVVILQTMMETLSPKVETPAS